MNKSVIVEFAQSLSDEDLLWLASRLTEKLQGDVGEALNFMSRFKSIDGFLSSSRSSTELYEFCDQIRDVLQTHCKKRNLKIGA